MTSAIPAVLVVGVILTLPANLLVRKILEVVRAGGEGQSNGAGRWIGILERLLIYVLVLGGQPAAAGVVVAAKSILRFPEISSEPKQIAPEYVLIGSLASWLLAFAGGVGVVAWFGQPV